MQKDSSQVSFQELCLEQPVNSGSQTRTELATHFAQSSLPYLPVLGNGWVLWEGGSWTSTHSVSSVDYYYCLNFAATNCSNNSQPFLLTICILLCRNKTKRKERQQCESMCQLYLTSTACKVWGWKPHLKATSCEGICGLWYVFFHCVLSALFHS